MRIVLGFTLLGCSSSPPTAHAPAPGVAPLEVTWSTGIADDAPWCTALAHRTPIGGVRFVALPGGHGAPLTPIYACAFGNAPAADFAYSVARDPLLQACLELLDEASLADVELVVASTGQVSAVAVRRWTGDRAVTRCAQRLLGKQTRAIGCRWRTQTTLARVAYAI